jgi:hypothetical protein
MPRPRQRVRLQDGLKLDLNRLIRQGLVRPGERIGPYLIRWTYTYTGEEIASALITAKMENQYEGELRIKIGSFDQTIFLVPRARHFGGHQWYFICPVMNRCCSFGCPPARHVSAAAKRGGGGSLTPRNLPILTIALTSAKLKLNRD